MKKIISIFLTLQLMVSMFAVANAEGTKYYYTQVDLTNYFDSVAFLSEKPSDEEISAYTTPNFFIETSNGKSSAAFAIDKNAFDQKYPNGKLTTEDGTPYTIKSNDGTPGAMKKHGGSFNFPANYYSQMKLLAVRPINALGIDGAHDHVYCTAYAGNQKGNVSYVLNSNVPRKEVGEVTYIVSGSANANDKITEHTVTFSDNDKQLMLDRFGFWIAGGSKNSMRYLAVTLVQTDADVKKYIDEKVASVLSQTTPSQDKVLEINEYMEKMAGQGFNLDTVSQISEFNALKAKFVSVKDYKENTDSEFVKMNINFSTPVTEASAVKDNFTVTRKGNNVDFELETIKTDDKITGVTVKMKNDINYADEIKIVVSKNIKNADDENFTLGKDKEITFTPTAPDLYIKSATATNGNVNITLKNNSSDEKTYALLVGIYSKDNEMVDKKVWTGAYSDSNNTFTKDFSDGEYTVEVSLLDSLEKLTILDYKNID